MLIDGIYNPQSVGVHFIDQPSPQEFATGFETTAREEAAERDELAGAGDGEEHDRPAGGGEEGAQGISL